MRNLVFAVVISALFALTTAAQAPAPAAGASAPSSSTSPAPDTATAAAPAKKRGPVFRATKAQIKIVQTMLKDKKLYAGEPTGTLDDATRTAVKSFQGDSGLKQTGTLNRATLEKMNVELTDTQKTIPVSPNSFAAADSGKTSDSAEKPKRIIFRATKDQITEAQTMLKAKGLYAGEATGKLDDATRAALRKFQTDGGVKATGTLNRATVEKMGIALTDKQKAAATAEAK